MEMVRMSLTAAPWSLWNLLCLHTHTVVLATVIAAVFSSPELTNCCTNGSKSTTKDHIRAWNEMHKHSRRKMNLNCWKCQPCTVHLGEDVLRSSRMVCVCAAMSLHELWEKRKYWAKSFCLIYVSASEQVPDGSRRVSSYIKRHLYVFAKVQTAILVGFFLLFPGLAFINTERL